MNFKDNVEGEFRKEFHYVITFKRKKAELLFSMSRHQEMEYGRAVIPQTFYRIYGRNWDETWGRGMGWLVQFTLLGGVQVPLSFQAGVLI